MILGDLSILAEGGPVKSSQAAEEATKRSRARPRVLVEFKSLNERPGPPAGPGEESEKASILTHNLGYGTHAEDRGLTKITIQLKNHVSISVSSRADGRWPVANHNDCIRFLTAVMPLAGARDNVPPIRAKLDWAFASCHTAGLARNCDPQVPFDPPVT